MIRHFLVFVLVLLSLFVTSEVLPEKLNCPWQPHNAMNAWINEIRFAGINAAVEIAVLHFSSITVLSLWAVALTNQGLVLSSLSLANCSMHTYDRGGIGHIDLYVCKPADGFSVNTLNSLSGGGIAIVQTATIQKTFDVSSSSQYIRVLDYIAFGDVGLSNSSLNSAQFEGILPCALPLTSQSHIDASKSIQLVNGAGDITSIPSNCSSFYGQNSLVDIGEMRWQSELSQTFGDLNNLNNGIGGTEPYHIQNFICNNSRFQSLIQPLPFTAIMSIAPLETYSENLDCKMGLFEPFSSCISTCGSTFGFETRSRPVFRLPTGSGAECSTLGPTFESRSCASSGSICSSACSNSLQDELESDIDCGGGIPINPLDINSTLSESAMRIYKSSNGNGIIEPLPTSTQLLPCSRCTIGRTCKIHSDCSRDARLLCSSIGICVPYWLIEVPFWMAVNVSILGVSPMDLVNDSSKGVDILRSLITINSIDGFISSLKLANTTIGRMMYVSTSSSLSARRLNSFLRSLQGTTATDTATITTVLIAADTFTEASILVNALAANTPRVAFAIENALREQGLIAAHDVVVSSPIILSAAAAGTGNVPPVIIINTPPLLVVPVVPEGSSPVIASMSAGAIAGIAIGSIALVGIVGALVLAAFRVREVRQNELHRLEEISRLAHEEALARSTAAKAVIHTAPTLIRVSRAAETRTKETFQPTHAGETPETVLQPLSPVSVVTNVIPTPVIQAADTIVHEHAETKESPEADVNPLSSTTTATILLQNVLDTVDSDLSVKKENKDHIPNNSGSDVGSVGSNTTGSVTSSTIDC